MANKDIFNAAYFFMSFLFVMVTGAVSQPQQTQLQISDDLLQKTVKAYRLVAQIQTDLENELQSAENQKERVQMQHNANARIVEAVKSVGISYETYDEVLRQVSTDKKLAQRFRKLLKDR